MKKFVTFILASALALSMAGCTNGTAKKAMEEAKLSLADKDYNAALSYGKLAIDEGCSDRNFRTLMDAVEDYISIKNKIDSGDVAGADTALAALPDYSSTSIASDLDALRQTVADKKSASEASAAKLAQAQSLLDAGSTSEAQNVLSSIPQDSLNNDQKSTYSALQERTTAEISKQTAQASAEAAQASAKAAAADAVAQAASKAASAASSASSGYGSHMSGWYTVSGAESGKVYVWKGYTGEGYYQTVNVTTQVYVDDTVYNGRVYGTTRGGITGYFTAKYLH